MIKKSILLFFIVLSLITPAFALNYAEVQKLSVQYNLHQAIPVFSGHLQRGWHNYGSVTIPNWNHVYLVIIPYAESGHRITVKVNGYDVITNRPLSSTVTADITSYVNPGDTARIDIWCSGTPRVAIFLAPPNDVSNNSVNSANNVVAMSNPIDDIGSGLWSINGTVQFIKYALICLFMLIIAVLAVVLVKR